MILVKQAQRSVKPFPTPPFPSKSSTLAGPRQMAPDLFLNPIADERKTPTGVTHRKVVHPTAKNRIDLFDQATDGLRLIALENNSQLAQQGRPLLDLRYPQRHPSSLTTPDPPELKAQKSKALALLQIHVSALVLIHLNLEFCQFLPNTFLDCLPKPQLPPMRVHQNHHIISESGVLHIRPPLVLRDLLRPFQHLVDFIEVDVAEQRRDDSTYAKGNLCFGHRRQ